MFPTRILTFRCKFKFKQILRHYYIRDANHTIQVHATKLDRKQELVTNRLRLNLKLVEINDDVLKRDSNADSYFIIQTKKE